MENLQNSGLILRTLQSTEWAQFVEDCQYNFTQILNLPGFRGRPGQSITGPAGQSTRGSKWIFVTYGQMQTAYGVTSVEQITLSFINAQFNDNPTIFQVAITIPGDTQLIVGDVLVLPTGQLIELLTIDDGITVVTQFVDTGITFAQVSQLTEQQVINIFNTLYTPGSQGAFRYFNAVAKNVDDASPALNNDLNQDSVIDIVVSGAGPGVAIADHKFVGAPESEIDTLTKMCLVAGSVKRYHQLIQATQQIHTNNYAPGVDDFNAFTVLQNSYKNGIIFGHADSESIRDFGRLYKSVNSTILTSSYSPVANEFSELQLSDIEAVIRSVKSTINVTTMDVLAATYNSRFFSYAGTIAKLGDYANSSLEIYSPQGVYLKNITNSHVLSTDATGKIVKTYSVITSLTGTLTNQQLVSALALQSAINAINAAITAHDIRITALENASNDRFFKKITWHNTATNLNTLTNHGNHLIVSGTTISNFLPGVTSAIQDLHVNSFVMNPDDSSTFRLLQEVTFAGDTEFISYMNGIKWFRIGTRATAASLWSWSPWSKTVTGADKVIGQDGLNSSGSFNTGNMTVKHNLKAAGLTDSTNSANTVIRNVRFDDYGHIIDYESHAVDAVPPGTVIYTASTNAPTGYLKCNGASISKTAYAELFNVIGSTFGSTSSNFTLPDLRGRFVRSWSDGSTVDSGRTFGSIQLDAIQRIIGNIGEFNTFAAIKGTSTGPFARTNTTVQTGIGSGNGDMYTKVDYDNNRVARTANETRPVNISLLACIKY